MAESLPLYQRVGVLRPLQHRDFRLLWIGQTVSMIGDGVYVFAVAWYVYKDLNASPATFALVGFAWSAPQVLLLLATGALSDRMDRRHLMIIGDLLRLLAISAIGTLDPARRDDRAAADRLGAALRRRAGDLRPGVQLDHPDDRARGAPGRSELDRVDRPTARVARDRTDDRRGGRRGRGHGLGVHRRRADVRRLSALHLADARARRPIRPTRRGDPSLAGRPGGDPLRRREPVAPLGIARRDDQPLLRVGAVGDARPLRRHGPDVGHRASARVGVRCRRRRVGRGVPRDGAARAPEATAHRDVRGLGDRHGHDGVLRDRRQRSASDARLVHRRGFDRGARS